MFPTLPSLTIEPNINLVVLAITFGFVSLVLVFSHDLWKRLHFSKNFNFQSSSKNFAFHRYIHWVMLLVTAITIVASLGVEFKQKPKASKATVDYSILSLSPENEELVLGKTKTVHVMLDTGEVTTNAFSAFLIYPTDKLEVAWINYDPSAFAIKAEESYGGGSIEITRGNLEEVKGSVYLAHVGFTGKATGSAKVSFASGSAIPRISDNTNSLNLSLSKGGVYNIISDVPEEVSIQTDTPVTSPSSTGSAQASQSVTVATPSASTTPIASSSSSIQTAPPSVKIRMGDLNKDGRVNSLDLSILLKNWNQAKGIGKIDLNEDERINLYDLPIMFKNWNN